MEPTLTVTLDGKTIFTSAARWLHPLFELERFLDSTPCDRARLVVKDKIVGRAAAMLLVRLGIRRVQAGILSLPGREVLEAHAVQFEYGELVARIECQTEELLLRETDLERAYALLAERAGAPQADRSGAGGD